MSLARVALQVGMLFCLMAAFVGAAAELATETIIWRSLFCGVAGAGLGAATGALIKWFSRIYAEGSGLPVEATAESAMPAETAPVMVEEHGSGG